MNRRRFLTTTGLTTALLLAGCLGNGDDNGNGDGNGNENGNDNGNGETETLDYAELEEDAQAFLDAVESGHELQWIGLDGERHYIESVDGRWESVDEPLAPEFLSDDIERLLDGEAVLKRDGETYRLWRYSGHDFYGARYGLGSEDDCDGGTESLDAFDGEKRDLLDMLVAEGEVTLADPAYESVGRADVFVTPESELGSFLGETFIEPERCLEYDTQPVRVVYLGELQHESEGYTLEPVES